MIVKLKPDNTIGKFYSLSLNKEYVAEVIGRKMGDWYKIKCDDGHIREFFTNCIDHHFITIEEMRDKKLNDLGI
jgi:hypothetical protein